jgi:hypothetical protein
VVLSSSSSVINARIENWSEGDGNELVLHVSQVSASIGAAVAEHTKNA